MRGPGRSRICGRLLNAGPVSASHPFGRLTIGTDDESSGLVTRGAVRDFYDAYYRPERAVLIVVGESIRPRSRPRSRPASATGPAAARRATRRR